MSSPAESCCHAWRGEFTSGARSCHFLKRPLFIQRPVHSSEDRHTTVFSPYNRLLLLADSLQKPRVAFGWGALLAMWCRDVPGAVLCSVLEIHSSNTGVHWNNAESDHVSWHALKVMVRAWHSFFAPCHPSLYRFQLAYGTEKERMHSKRTTHPYNSARTWGFGNFLRRSILEAVTSDTNVDQSLRGQVVQGPFYEVH